MSVSNRFQSLLAAIEPNPTEIQTYDGHYRTIARRTEIAFPRSGLEVIGSYSRDAGVHKLSDLDVLLRLPRDEARWGDRRVNSKTVLDRVRLDMSDRYTATDIRRDAQAVVVKFGQGSFAVDVVPAIFDGMTDPVIGKATRPRFLIPDGNGDWMPTSPQAHKAFIGAADDRSRGKLKFTTQLVKFWRSCRTPAIPLLSFHAELLMAEQDICVGAKSYQQCLYDLFKLLRARECRALQDPVGISGLICATKTDAQRDQLLGAVDSAYGRAEKALLFESNGPLPYAYALWNLVFNDQFPKSG